MSNNNDAQLMRVSPADRGEHGMARADALGGEVSRSAEMSVAQLEAQARATVQARFFMAAKMRRTWDDVEQRLIRECRRPRFAASAWYVKPIGKDEAKWPRGLSIRFAEAALRVAGNIDVQIQAIFDDDWKRIVRVSVLDLETNFGYTKEVTIDKTVERRYPDKTREPVSVRMNSSGEPVYTVIATEDEVMVKQNALVSKEIRTQGLRLIPGDILDECKEVVQATIRQGATAEDPETARKSVFDNFSTIGVMPADIAKYLEHDTANLLPAEVVTLRGIFTAIKNGEVAWKDVMQAKFGAEEGEESAAAKKLRETLAKKTAPKTEPKQEQPTAPKQEPKPEEKKPAPVVDQPKQSEPELVSKPSPKEYASRNEMPDPMELRVGTEVISEGRRFLVVDAGDDLHGWREVGMVESGGRVKQQRSAKAFFGDKE